jgi:hypothetical protein
MEAAAQRKVAGAWGSCTCLRLHNSNPAANKAQGLMFAAHEQQQQQQQQQHQQNKCDMDPGMWRNHKLQSRAPAEPYEPTGVKLFDVKYSRAHRWWVPVKVMLCRMRSCKHPAAIETASSALRKQPGS